MTPAATGDRLASTMVTMSDAANSVDRPDGLVVLPLEEAVRQATPWTADATTGIEDVTDEEWDAFMKALATR
jgi:hypothetical protein